MRGFLTAVLILGYITALILFRIYLSSVHEYIHYYFANRYKACKALIVSQFNLYKKNPNIKWLKHERLTGGVTYIDNDFLAYSERQIKVIAVMPKVITIIIYNLINLGFILPLYRLYRDNNDIIKVVIYLITVALAVSVYEFFRGKSTWCDRDIFFNPRGFKEYMRNQHENSLADSYQYNIIKRNKQCHTAQKKKTI